MTDNKNNNMMNDHVNSTINSFNMDPTTSYDNSSSSSRNTASLNIENETSMDITESVNVASTSSIGQLSVPLTSTHNEISEQIISQQNTDDLSVNETIGLIPDFEAKYSLSILKYPDCAEAAVKAIIDLINNADMRGEKKIEMISYLTNEFIFGKIEKLKAKGIPRAHSEFQLINIIIEYVCDPNRTSIIRNSIMLSIFNCGNPRYKYLGNVVCFCICIPHIEIVDAAGVWMQQLGSKSEFCQKFAVYIIEYFWRNAPGSMENLMDMTKLSPHFSSNLLTAITAYYRMNDPPDEILQLVDDWLNFNINILTAALIYYPELPPGAISMTPITPIAGILRWCVLGPSKRESCYYDQTDHNLCRRFMLYNHIHSRLVYAIEALKANVNNKYAISAFDLEETMHTLTDRLNSKLPYVSKHSYDLGIERLRQVVHAALKANCIYGNISKLLYFFEIFERVHASNIQPR